MNVIKKSISDVMFTIPEEILQAVFIPKRSAWSLRNTTIEAQIHDLVVRPRVLVDCDIVGGTEVYIPIDNLPKEQVDNRTFVFHVPKEKTQGRTILSLGCILFYDPMSSGSYGVGGLMEGGTMVRASNAMVDSVGSMPVVSTSNIELIAENAVMVFDFLTIPANSFLKCRLASDERMSHLPIRAYLEISQLVEYAVKAYIYNKAVVVMDMGELFAGSQLGRIREVIDGYSDAEELYKTHRREVIQKVLYMSDNQTMTNHIRLMIGRR